MHLGVILTANVSVQIVVSVTVHTKLNTLHFTIQYIHKSELAQSQTMQARHHGVVLFRASPFLYHPTHTLQLTTTRDCFGVVVTGARGLRTCNKNKEKRMCRVTPPYSIRTAGAGPLVFIFFLAKPGLYPAGHSGSCLNFKGEGVTNYLPNSHQISSLLAANTKKLTSRK